MEIALKIALNWYNSKKKSSLKSLEEHIIAEAFLLSTIISFCTAKMYHYTHKGKKSANYHTMLHIHLFNEFTSFIMRNKTFCWGEIKSIQQLIEALILKAAVFPISNFISAVSYLPSSFYQNSEQFLAGQRHRLLDQYHQTPKSLYDHLK